MLLGVGGARLWRRGPDGRGRGSGAPTPPPPASRTDPCRRRRPGITTLLSTVLGYEGFSVQVALSGADALRVAPAFRAQLVLLDVMLPDVDGFEVHRALLADGMTAPVLYVTARPRTAVGA